MPLIDMPLVELEKYPGRNPRPADFDEYWDSSLDEMHNLESEVEMIPHDIKSTSAECYDQFFTGVGGARIHAKYLRPKNIVEKHPAIVILHGYSGHSGDWFGHLAWVSQGYSVAAIDVRGQGGYSEDTGGTTGNTLHGHIIRGLSDDPKKLLFRSIYLDCAQLAGIVMEMPEVDADRVGVTGGSQGGGLTLACAALEPRLKLAAPIFPFLCDFLRVWEMDLAVGAYAELREYLRFFDPRHEHIDETFLKLGYIDNQHLAPRIKSEVLMITGLMDTICPPSTQFAAYNKISAKKNVVIYPDFGHEGLPDSSDIVLRFMAGL